MASSCITSPWGGCRSNVPALSELLPSEFLEEIPLSLEVTCLHCRSYSPLLPLSLESSTSSWPAIPTQVACMHLLPIPPFSPRPSFAILSSGLLSLVESEVLQEHEQSPNRPLFLVGESFGALLAAAVAARNPSLPLTLVLINSGQKRKLGSRQASGGSRHYGSKSSGSAGRSFSWGSRSVLSSLQQWRRETPPCLSLTPVLINSATSFPRSSLQPLIPLLKSVPAEAYSALPFLFSLAIVNPIRISSGGLPLDASPLDRLEKLKDNLLGLLPSLPLLMELLPQATLEWKLHLLESGSAFTEPLLPSVRAPTLIIAG
ncbi:unnamed protein product, partial [Closterium sp. Naga37s-1]